VSGCKRPGFFGALPVTGVDYCLNGVVLPVSAIPSGFATSTLTVTGFTLTWSADTDNVAVTGYEVFRNGITAASPPRFPASSPASRLTPGGDIARWSRVAP